MKKIKVDFPKDYPAENLAGKEAEFEVTVNKIEEPKLPELDDALAEKVGIEGGIEALKSQVREGMERELKQAIDTRIKMEVLDKLIELNPIEIPASLPPEPTPENPSLGRGGTVILEADEVDLQDSSILAETEGFTRGGNVNLATNLLTLDNSNIAVRSERSGDSGSINIQTLQDGRAIIMRNRSVIETDADGSGNGGNIQIETPFLIGFDNDGSDIIANAIGGEEEILTLENKIAIETTKRVNNRIEIT